MKIPSSLRDNATRKLRYKGPELNKPQTVCSFGRKPSTEHPWYDGVIIVSLKNCPRCSSTRLSKMVASVTKGFGGYSLSMEAGADGAREDFVNALAVTRPDQIVRSPSRTSCVRASRNARPHDGAVVCFEGKRGDYGADREYLLPVCKKQNGDRFCSHLNPPTWW